MDFLSYLYLAGLDLICTELNYMLEFRNYCGFLDSTWAKKYSGCPIIHLRKQCIRGQVIDTQQWQLQHLLSMDMDSTRRGLEAG